MGKGYNVPHPKYCDCSTKCDGSLNISRTMVRVQKTDVKTEIKKQQKKTNKHILYVNAATTGNKPVSCFCLSQARVSAEGGVREGIQHKTNRTKGKRDI